MSERLKSTNTISNEDVIEDLTRDLESKLNIENTAPEYVINPESSVEDYLPSGGDATGKTEVPTTDVEFDKDDQHDKSSGSDEEHEDSDGEALESRKLSEKDLTDDQKAERRVIAEELKLAGNEAFKVGDYDGSIEKYKEGLRVCPLQFTKQRAVLYCNRSAARMKLGDYKRAVRDCGRAIELDDKYMKAYYRRAQSYEAMDKLHESLEDYKKIVELDPSHKKARAATVRLPPLIEEKNEKLKAEMLGKLKDLGNMILKPFGLSTNNFQMEQDPDTKGYKINFKQ